VTIWLKAGIVEQTNQVIARQQCGKHISVGTDTDAITEDIVFYMRSMPRLYNED
jgi:hypothetical protein